MPGAVARRAAVAQSRRCCRRSPGPCPSPSCRAVLPGRARRPDRRRCRSRSPGPSTLGKQLRDAVRRASPTCRSSASSSRSTKNGALQATNRRLPRSAAAHAAELTGHNGAVGDAARAAVGHRLPQAVAGLRVRGRKLVLRVRRGPRRPGAAARAAHAPAPAQGAPAPRPRPRAASSAAAACSRPHARRAAPVTATLRRGAFTRRLGKKRAKFKS